MLLSNQRICCCVQHCDSYGSDIWQVCLCCDRPASQQSCWHCMALAPGFWRQRAPCGECMLTNAAWPVGNSIWSRAIWPPYGHRMATVWPSGHLHLLHHVVANAVCTFPNASSLFQASPVPSVNVVDPSVCAACMQIRVQLGAEGFPLYGDTMYANMAHSSSPKVGKPQ